MHIRSHIIISAIVGFALYPRQPKQMLIVTAAGTLVDLDHLVLYALRSGDWSIVGALRYDRYRHGYVHQGDNRPRYGSLRSWLHQPMVTLPLLWSITRQWPQLRPLAYGISLHLLLDHLHTLIYILLVLPKSAYGTLKRR
ncbi:hypothetical protein [Candidatus Viridilinea mediisalina]|uniref:Metal-dependent hydrolase n=1 Tax=Candidatus Viridilinea mediisalina TaxID=2024553 RepID=A0A2A6RDN8_9CHLR|nr:hypothetical protein [Candidatus Viridilinea mediisalina]PDW00309.1 hypothetical protein CJ255_20840 [Candidatus Viridilinea mediisalina]